MTVIAIVIVNVNVMTTEKVGVGEAMKAIEKEVGVEEVGAEVEVGVGAEVGAEVEVIEKKDHFQDQGQDRDHLKRL